MGLEALESWLPLSWIDFPFSQKGFIAFVWKWNWIPTNKLNLKIKSAGINLLEQMFKNGGLKHIPPPHLSTPFPPKH